MILKGLIDSLHAYAYGRWTTQVIKIMKNYIIPRLDADGRKKFSDGFHYKVLTHEHAKNIVTIEKDIPRTDLEQIIPYPQARTIVLKAPPDIVLRDCACRSSKKDHCGPVQVCMIMGKPITDFVLKHHPGTSRRIGRDEALQILHDEHERGHVHTAWFKDVIGGRFYALCNCCKCCCFGIEAMMKHRIPMAASSGYTAVAEREKCASCGTCAEMCPFDAITYGPAAAVSREKCMGCGVCISQCKNGAIRLERDESRGIPLDVKLLFPDSGALHDE